MQDNLHSIVNALALTLLPNQHQKGEQALTELSKTVPNYPQLLREILLSNIDDNLQLAAATTLNSALLQKISTLNESSLIQFLSSILLEGKINNLHKRCLQRFTIALAGKCAGQNVTQMISLFKELLNTGQLDSAFMMIGAFAVGEVKEHNLVYFIKEVFGLCVNLLGNNVKVELAAGIHEWMKSMGQVMDKLSIKNKHTTEESAELGLALSLNSDFCRLIQKVYELYPASPAHYITSQPDLLELNMLKNEACQVHLKMLKFGQDAQQQVNPLSIFTNTATPFFFNSLIFIANNQSLADDLSCDDFVVSIMKILTNMAKQDTFYNVFAQIKEELIRQVIFPFLSISKEEYELFKTEPVEFSNLASDTCEKQMYGSIKTQAAALLEALADSIDGVTSLLVSACVTSLKIGYNLETSVNPPILSRQQSIMILSILSCQISNRPDLLCQLRQLLKNSHPILSQCNQLQLCRLYIFLGYNFTDLFDQYIEIGEPYLASAYSLHTHPTVNFIALDLIYNMSERYCSPEFLRVLIERLLTCEVGILWDIFSVCITKNLNEMNQPLLTELVINLYQRVQIELNRLIKNQIDNTLLLTKCLNVVKAITEVKNYLVGKPFLEENIWKFHQFLKFAKNIEFEDDIIEIINGVLIQKPHFEERELALLPYIRNVFDKDQHIIYTVFQTINMYILFTPMQKEDATTMALLEMCVQGLNPTSPKKQDEDTGDALLLLQLFILKTRKFLSEGTLAQLGLVLKNLLNSTQSTVNLARTLNCLVLLYPFLNTIEIFPLVSAKYNFFSGYDRTVLVIALCNILLTESNPAVVVESMSLIIKHLQMQVDASKQPQKFVYNKKTKKKKIITPNASFLKSITKLNSPWKNEEKFSHFRTVIETMRNNNKGAYDSLISILPEEAKTGLGQLYGLTSVGKEIRKTIKVRKDVFNKQPNLPKENKLEMNIEEEEKDSDDDQENKLIRKRLKQQAKQKAKGKKKGKMKSE